MLLVHVLPVLLLCIATTRAQNVTSKPYQMSSRFGEKYDEALEAIFSVAVRLEALLSDTGVKTSQNFMVSPLSMAVAVGELMLGARGVLQQQLYELLVVDSQANRSQSVRHIKHENNTDIPYYALHEQLGDLMQNLQERGAVSNTYTLKTASVLFAQQNLSVNDDFRTNIKKFYGTNIEELDFKNDPVGCEKIVNKWAHDNTQGLIKSILPGPLPAQTVGILANAVYFRGDWEIPFSFEVNRKGVFHTSPTSTVNVTYMMGEFENYKYVDSKRLNCRMVVIPYQNSELTMNIVLPNPDKDGDYDINQFTSSLRIKDLLELIQSAKDRKVFMFLPKMSLSNTINMLEPLRRYHKYKSDVGTVSSRNNDDELDRLDEKIELFKNTSSISDRSPTKLDLSGISEDPQFQISNIYQQMTLSVNEKGTEAAAVAASAIDYILESVNFNVNRPFLFFIRHEATGATLFWGTIVNPIETSD
ncbi:Serpin 28Dc [Carabus blaptoides fortunei]